MNKGGQRNGKKEMSVQEWLIRMPCALLSLAIAFAALGGVALCTLEGVNAVEAAGNDLLYVPVILAVISSALGVPVMAKSINDILVRVLTKLYEQH